MSISIKKAASSALPLYFLIFSTILPGVGYCSSSVGVSADQVGSGIVAGIQDAIYSY